MADNSSDPYAGLGSPTPPAPAPAPAPADPYAGLGSPTPPPESDPYAGLGTPTPPPSQTEENLRQIYTQEMAKTGGSPWLLHPLDSAGTAISTVPGAAWNMVKDLPQLVRLLPNPQNPVIAPETIQSVLEGGYQAGAGIGKLLSGLVTGPAAAIKTAYQQYTGTQPTPNDEYEQWRLNYLQNHTLPGYAPAPADESSAIQNAESAWSGGSLLRPNASSIPAAALPAPDPALANAVSTAAVAGIPLGAVEGIAGKLIPKALEASGLAEVASKYAPTLANIGDTAGAQAAKIRNAMNEAIEPGSTPFLAKDVTAPFTQAATGMGDAAVNLAGKGISALGDMATGIAQRISNIPGMGTDFGKYLLTSALGPYSKLAFGTIKALESLGPKATDVGDFLSRVATSDPNNPFGRFAALAQDSTAPDWMRRWIKNLNPGIKLATLAGGAAEDFTKGAITGAGVSILSGNSPEETGSNMAGFGLFGALHGAMSASQAEVFDAQTPAVTKFITDALSSGIDPETLRLAPAGIILKSAQLHSALPDVNIRFVTSEADAPQGTYPFGADGVAPGQGGYYDRPNKTLWLDPTHRDAESLLLHEAMHPIFDNLVAQQPEIKATIDTALKNSGISLDEFKQQYANAAFPNDPQAAASYIQTQDQANPDWAYSEMMSESAAHNLQGKDLLSVMQKGTPVEQTATEAALQGVKGWLSDMGVNLQDTQTKGTMFPDFTQSFNDPALRKLTYKLLKAQRDSLLQKPTGESPSTPLTQADMGGKKAPLYQGPNNEKINAYGREITAPNGKTSFKPWPASELRKRAKAEFDARKKYFPEPGKLITQMPAGLENDPSVAPWTKQALRSVFDSIANKSKLSAWYHRLNSDNSSTSDKGWAADVRRNLGNVEVSYQSGRPVGVHISGKGNLNVKFESEEAENQKLAAWSQRHGDLSLDLWGGDQAKAKADIATYLENHATGQPGDANGIGEKKKNVINALLAGSNKEFEATNPLRAQIKKADRQGTIRDLRVDRMESATPEEATRPVGDWEKQKQNLSPAAEEPGKEEKQEPGKLYSGQFSPSADPAAVKTAAIYDRQNERYYEGMIHAVAWDNYLNDTRFGKNKNPYKMKDGTPRIEEGFTTNDGEFLDRKEALERAAFLNQYKAQPVNKTGNLEAYEFQKQQGVPKKTLLSQFSPSAKRDIEITGPDGKKYPAEYGGIQETLDPKAPWLTITPKVDLPGATSAKSTTYAHSLAKKGYTVPPELYKELENHAAPGQQQFSPAASQTPYDSLPNETKADIEHHLSDSGISGLDEDDTKSNLRNLAEEPLVTTGKISAQAIEMSKERQVSPVAVRKYAARFKAGENAPPIVVEKIATGLKLLEGGNRLAAAKKAGVDIDYADISALKSADWGKWVNGEQGHNMPTTQPRFSPSADPRAIKNAAVRDEETGKVYEGFIHADAVKNYLNDRFPEENTRMVVGPTEEDYSNLTHGFTTNNGKFLDREQALKRAISLKQYKPHPSDSSGRLEAIRFEHQQKPSQFSPSADGYVYHATNDPNGIAAAARRDKQTGRIFAGENHRSAGAKSPKAGEDLEDGFVTNSGEFLTRDQAFKRAVDAQQYKPSDEDYNVNKILYGLTSERFNKQNPSAGFSGVKAAEEALSKVQSTDLRPGVQPAIRWKGKIYTQAQLAKMPGSHFIDKLQNKGVLKESDWVEEDYDNPGKRGGYIIEHGFSDKNGKWVNEKNAYKPIKQRPSYSPAVEAKNVRQPDEEIRKQAADYTAQAELSHSPFTGYAPLNEDLGKRIADAYEAAPHIPDDPKVLAAYKALANETRAQWDYLTKKGVKFEPWTKEGQPYQASKDMRIDVQQNKHLWFFPTEQGFGEGEAKTNNPMLQPTGIEVDKVPLVANDLFRAVHDYFGHAKEGYEFGPRGEYNAYLAHSRMFSDAALPALTAETMGQNSWVNFGKHLRNEKGNIPKKGEEGYVSPQDRPFAEQKATVLPDDLMKESLDSNRPRPTAKAPQFSPRGGDFPAQFRDIDEQRREDDLPPDVIDFLKQEIGTAKIRLSDARKVRQGFKPTTGTLKSIFAPDGKLTLDKAAQALEPYGITGDEDLFERIERAAAAREKLWDEHVKNTAPRKPFDQLEYEKAQALPFSPAAQHPATLTRQEMAKWLLDNKAWDSIGALDAKAARAIARKGKSWMLTTLPTDYFDHAPAGDSHAAPGQPIVAHYTKDGWQALDGQHRVSAALAAGVESLPAYIPVEHKAESFSPAAKEGNTDPLYYSKLKNVVDEKFSGESMPAAQLAAVLRNPNSGIKADEMKWSGIDDFLKGKHRVSKEEVQNFLDNQDMTPRFRKLPQRGFGLPALAAPPVQPQNQPQS